MGLCKMLLLNVEGCASPASVGTVVQGTEVDNAAGSGGTAR
jgi:hypothetical protein